MSGISLTRFKDIVFVGFILEWINQEIGNKNGIRWVLLGSGILLACVGIGFLSGDAPNWLFGLPSQALAFWALWNAFPIQSRSLPETVPKTTPLRKNETKWLWLVLAVITSWVFAYYCFSRVWWIAGIVTSVGLLGALILCAGRWKNPPPVREYFSDNTAIIILMILTVLLRFPFLNQFFAGLQNDEAHNFLDTLDVLRGIIKSPFGSSFDLANLTRFLIAPFVYIFGANFTAAKGATTLTSTLCIYFFYRWCRLYFGVGASLLASSFFSFCWWDLFFSRSLLENIFTNCFEVLAFFFLSKAVREGGKWNFAWSGICLAISVLTYTSGRLVPVIAVFVIIVYWLLGKRKFPKFFVKEIVFLSIFFLWMIGPYLVFIYHKPDELYGRAARLNIIELVMQKHAYLMPLERVLSTFYTFLFPNNPAVDLRFGLTSVPCLDPFLGLFFLLGVVLAVYFLRQWRNLLALTGILFGLMANAFISGSTEIDLFSFHAGRCFFIFPFLCFLMAQGMDWGIRLVSSLPKKLKISCNLALVLLAVCSAYTNIDTYFFKFRNTLANYFPLAFNHLAVVELFKNYYLKDHVVVEGINNHGTFSSGAFDLIDRALTLHNAPVNFDGPTYGCYDFLGRDPAKYGIPVNLGWPLPLPIRAQVTKSVVIFFPFWEAVYYEPEKGKVRQFYPNAVWETHKNQYGEGFVMTAEIKIEDIQNLQKGMKLDPPLY